ncbi:MAG: Smr/MutS family protein [Bacteroidales bacterium]|nr:Smr/MutS family protein [Bacteroidales bacterium]
MNIEKSIEIQEIKREIASLCQSSGAKTLAEEIKFLCDYNQVKYLLEQSSEMKNILLGIKSFPSENYIDMTGVLSTLRVKDSCISQTDMKDLLLSLSTIKEILSFFNSDEKGLYPVLNKEAEKVNLNEEILNECSFIIDTDGEIKDSCSPTLREIRQKQLSKQKEMNRRIQSILSKTKSEGWTNTEDDITVRNDRLVIPVKSSYKKYLKGILHDTSQSGQTFYIEPDEIVEINFDIKELYIEEEREIHRILLAFSEKIRENIDDLLSAYTFLVLIDFIRAKGLYAIRIKAGKPDLQSTLTLNWYDARHPILETALKLKNKEIVPLRIELNSEKRILIISGPNAGGKSVCLKTVALLQYMLQCGLLIPVKETSQAGLFNQIFISIGDDQSIENDLSTYSSHLLNMKNLCDNADKDSLFLIDECGTGTDPLLGGAIAESILEYLNEIKAWGVVTTHYSNLKHLALNHHSIVNAAMLFDTENMKPLFTLSIGTPGSSFAFEIAEKTGLNKQIIENAKKKTGENNIRFEQQLQQIEVEKLALAKENKRMKDYDDMLYETVQKYKSLEAELQQEKRNILNSARNQAKEILSDANRQIEHAIEQVKQSKAEKEKVKQVKQEVKQKIEKIQQDIKETKEKTPITQTIKKTNLKLLNTPIKEGDLVIMGEEETVMEVKKINRNTLELINGIMTIRTHIDNVKKIDKQSYLKQQNNKQKNSFTFNPIMDRINNIRATFSPNLDLRGERTEQAIKKVEQLLDTARLLGENQIKILHGKGDGILKVMIRDYLKTLPEVKAFYPEKIEFGGEGITVVELV